MNYSQVSEVRGLTVLRQLGLRYVVLKQYNVPDPASGPLRTSLEREGRLLASFSPYRPSVRMGSAATPPFLHNTDASIDRTLVRPGPIIEVWEIQ